MMAINDEQIEKECKPDFKICCIFSYRVVDG